MTGMRKKGEKDFRFSIRGNAAQQFPPLLLKMTLHELQQLLHAQQSVPENEGKQAPRLRAVG